MDVIILEGEEAKRVTESFRKDQADVAAFMKKHGITSGEALVLSDPPVSDVDVD